MIFSTLDNYHGISKYEFFSTTYGLHGAIILGMASRKRNLDSEIQSLSEVVVIFERLDEDARGRIIEYLLDRYTDEQMGMSLGFIPDANIPPASEVLKRGKGISNLLKAISDDDEVKAGKYAIEGDIHRGLRLVKEPENTSSAS